MQFSQHHVLKILSFPHWIFGALLSNISWLCMCGRVFLGSLFCSNGLCVSFYTSTLPFWLLELCSIVWNQEVWCLQFSSFSGLFWLFRISCSSQFRIIYSVKNAIGILIGIVLNLQMALGRVDILTILILTYECRRLYVFFNFFYQSLVSFHCTDLPLPWLNLFLHILFLILLWMGLFCFSFRCFAVSV